ncbi:unnamed protein product [Brugia timori]|uniref:Secreted protein n=1 Tax=Brugia timori TaxID=42155 RepID=A0A0R3Q7V5_9BILA|nr:unnamed protein product [Brugia timori]
MAIESVLMMSHIVVDSVVVAVSVDVIARYLGNKNVSTLMSRLSFKLLFILSHLDALRMLVPFCCDPCVEVCT